MVIVSVAIPCATRIVVAPTTCRWEFPVVLVGGEGGTRTASVFVVVGAVVGGELSRPSLLARYLWQTHVTMVGGVWGAPYHLRVHHGGPGGVR